MREPADPRSQLPLARSSTNRCSRPQRFGVMFHEMRSMRLQAPRHRSGPRVAHSRHATSHRQSPPTVCGPAPTGRRAWAAFASADGHRPGEGDDESGFHFSLRPSDDPDPESARPTGPVCLTTSPEADRWTPRSTSVLRTPRCSPVPGRACSATARTPRPGLVDLRLVQRPLSLADDRHHEAQGAAAVRVPPPKPVGRSCLSEGRPCGRSSLRLSLRHNRRVP